MEAFAPTVLVKVGDEGVKLVHEVRGGQDARSDPLTVFLVEELVVRFYPFVHHRLRHRPGLPAERAQRVLAEPRQLHRDVDTTSQRHPTDDHLDFLVLERVHDARGSHLERPLARKVERARCDLAPNSEALRARTARGGRADVRRVAMDSLEDGRSNESKSSCAAAVIFRNAS